MSELIAPLAIFALVWGIALREVVRGWRRGEMREYMRRSSEDDRSYDTFCRRSKEPISFWCLFGFYCLIAVGVPVLIGIAIYTRSHRTE